MRSARWNMGFAGGRSIVGGSETRFGEGELDLTTLPLARRTATRTGKVGDELVGFLLARRFAQRSRICCCLEASP